MNSPDGRDAFVFPIFSPVFLVKCYRQASWQGLFSGDDALYYVQYDADYLLGGGVSYALAEKINSVESFAVRADPDRVRHVAI